MSHNPSTTRQCAGRNVVALIPAAGSGTRIAPIPGSKEVFPIGFANVEGDKPEVKVVSQYLFERLVVCVPSTYIHRLPDYYPAKLQHFPFTRPLDSLPVRLAAR